MGHDKQRCSIAITSISTFSPRSLSGTMWVTTREPTFPEGPDSSTSVDDDGDDDDDNDDGPDNSTSVDDDGERDLGRTHLRAASLEHLGSRDKSTPACLRMVMVMTSVKWLMMVVRRGFW